MLTYNPQISAFGYVSIRFDWSPSGTIDCSLLLKGMPAVPFGVSKTFFCGLWWAVHAGPGSSASNSHILTTVMHSWMQGHISFSNWTHFVPDLLLALMTAVFLPLTITDVVLQLRAEKRLRDKKEEVEEKKRSGEMSLCWTLALAIGVRLPLTFTASPSLLKLHA